jgi:thiamine kinase-like enzyme
MGIVEQLYQKITNENARSVRYLSDGFNNASYLINEEKVFRLKKMSDTPFYSTKNEGKILNLIAPNRIGPKLFYFDYQTGNMIDRYVKGDQRFLGESVDIKDLKALAGVLRRLHSVKGCSSLFYPEQRYDAYKARSGVSLDESKEKEIREKFLSFYSKEPLVLCHNDLVKGNVIIDPASRQIVLIDFEFAGLNSPYFDLASVLSENQIYDFAKDEAFVEAYFGKNCSLLDKKKTAITMAYQDYLWFYWASCRCKETGAKDFKAIADGKLFNIETMKKYFSDHPEMGQL